MIAKSSKRFPVTLSEEYYTELQRQADALRIPTATMARLYIERGVEKGADAAWRGEAAKKK